MYNRQNFNQNSLDSLESECKWSYEINPELMKPTLDNDDDDDDNDNDYQTQYSNNDADHIFHNHSKNNFKSSLSLKTKLSSNTNEIIKEDINEYN